MGLAGAALYIVAYGGLALGRIAPHGVRYHALNAAGAALMIYSLVYRFNISSFVVQALWLVFAIVGCVRARRLPPRG